MDWRLTDNDDGVLHLMTYDEVENRVVRQTSQDVEPILEFNKDAYINTPKDQLGRDMVHAARIPKVVIEKWKNELGVDFFDKNHWPKVKALLNDPDNRFLRTWQGRL